VTTPERFRRIKAHYLVAAELSARERASYLERLPNTDADLRTELEDLLRRADAASGIDLAAEAAVTPAEEAFDTVDEAPRRSIGGYRIIRPLGRGGMGAVYEAEQTSPKRRVALKVIRAGLAGAEAHRRFRLEAEILGRLEHEGIARVFEAGVAAGEFGEEPFIAMELVEGVDLARFVRERALDVRAILELLERVARAVAHAHQRGIVHRDLKPANILVAKDGGPKILDFGISRLTEDAVLTAAPATEAGQLVGTLAYMSPEQAGASPGDVDIRSDVYSLGVIAYELLSGRIPCELPRPTFAETVQAIRECEPAPLGRLVPTLDRDVAVIVHHALEKDRARRYASAEALADDLRRYLDDLPVAARPASAPYQLRKFVRRHRILVAGFVTTFLALAGGMVATTRQSMLKEEALKGESTAKETAIKRAQDAERAKEAADDARKKADAARLEAEDRLDEAQAVRKVLERTVKAARPEVLGRDVTVLDALEHAGEAVEKEFGDRPKVEATVRIALGKTCQSLGLLEQAKGHLERALELRNQVLPGDHVLVAEANRALGVVHLASGAFADAETLIEKAAGIYRRQLPNNGEYFASTLADLATARKKRGNLTGAAELYPEILATMGQSRTAATDAAHMGIMINNYGLLLRDLGRYGEARKTFDEALDVFEVAGRGADFNAATTKGNLAIVMQSLGKLAEAEDLFRESIKGTEPKAGPSHEVVTSAKANLASVLLELKRPEEAEAFAQAALDGRRAAGDGKRYFVAHSLGILAKVRAATGAWEESEKLLREALAIYGATIGESAEPAIGARLSLADVLLALGKNEEALKEYATAVAHAEKSLQSVDPLRGICLRDEGAALAKLGKFELAEPKLREAVRRLSEIFGDGRSETRRALSALADLLKKTGRASEAAAFEARLDAPESRTN
jgi:eukaryotic-like serine/threonine-protein kinase